MIAIGLLVSRNTVGLGQDIFQMENNIADRLIRAASTTGSWWISGWILSKTKCRSMLDSYTEATSIVSSSTFWDYLDKTLTPALNSTQSVFQWKTCHLRMNLILPSSASGIDTNTLIGKVRVLQVQCCLFLKRNRCTSFHTECRNELKVNPVTSH